MKTVAAVIVALATLAVAAYASVVREGPTLQPVPAELRDLWIGTLEPLPAEWEGTLARALIECPLGAPQTARAELVSPGGALSLRDMPLYSWIIAPRAVVATRVES